MIAQDDGPVLGKMVPIWVWQRGDRIRDIRYISVPGDAGPYTVHVGVFGEEGRSPAFVDGVQAPDDAVLVATLAN